MLDVAPMDFKGTCTNPRIRAVDTALLLSPQRAADFLGIGRTKLLALAKARRVKAVREGERTYFVRASLVEYQDSLPPRGS
jgi:hypothetical protein